MRREGENCNRKIKLLAWTSALAKPGKKVPMFPAMFPYQTWYAGDPFPRRFFDMMM
jgi:hypothetical protein